MVKENHHAHPRPSAGDNLPAALPHPHQQASPKTASPARPVHTQSPKRESTSSQLIPPPAAAQASKCRSSAYRFFPRFGDRGEPYSVKVRGTYEERFKFHEGGGL